MEDDAPLVIARSPLRVRVLSLLTAGVGAAALGHLAWGRIGGRRGQAAAVAALAGAGASAGRLISAEARAEPALVLTEKLLHDHATLAAAGTVPWSQVTGMRVRRFPGSDVIQLQVADADDLIRRRPWWSRPILRWNLRVIGAPVNLPLAACALGPVSLRDEVAERLDAARS